MMPEQEAYDRANGPEADDAGNQAPLPKVSLAAHAALVAGAALGMATGFAILFSGTFGLFIKPIGADLGWDRSEVSLILTMGYLGYALGSPIVGALYDRLGLANVQAVAIAVFAASLASLAILPPVLGAFMAGGLVIGLSGAATAPSGYVLILAKTIGQRLGLSVGLAMAGLGVGLSLAPALALASIDLLGWRQAYLSFGAMALAGGCVAWTLIRVSRGRIAAAASDTGVLTGKAGVAGPQSLEGMTLRQALGEWRFWMLGGTSLVVGAIGFGILAHLPAALSDRGVTDRAVAQIAGLMGLGILLGRVGAAMAMDRFFAPAIALVCYSIGALGLYGLAALPTEQLLLLQLSALAAGLLTGSEGDVMPFLTRHYFGLARFGAIFGCVIGLAGFGGLLGPVLFGYVFERTGSYDLALLAGAATCVVCGLMLMTMGPYRYALQVRRS